MIKNIPNGNITAIVGASNRLQYLSDLKEKSFSLGVPFFIQPKYGSLEYSMFIESLLELQCDFIIVNSYSMKLYPDVLEIPRISSVNIHGALLPRYRGCNPTQWALLNCESETGVTMHYMTEDFDAGDIICQRRVPIFFEDSWIEIQGRISSAAEEMLSIEIPKLLNGTNERMPQDMTQSQYFKRRKPEDGRIPWNKSVEYIYNLIRALVKPHPGAFYFNNEKKIILNEYLTIPKVTALKYSLQGGGQMLKSENAYLAPLTEKDSQIMLKWINNRNDASFNCPFKPISEKGYKGWFDSITNRNDLIIFGICNIELNELIGSCQLHKINFSHRNAEYQIQLGEKAHRGKGFRIQATKLLLDFAFNDLNLHRVYLNVFVTNERALKMYQKIGFVQEGILRNHAHINGEYVDVIIMGMLRSEFKQ